MPGEREVACTLDSEGPSEFEAVQLVVEFDEVTLEFAMDPWVYSVLEDSPMNSTWNYSLDNFDGNLEASYSCCS